MLHESREVNYLTSLKKIFPFGACWHAALLNVKKDNFYSPSPRTRGVKKAFMMSETAIDIEHNVF